MSVAGGLFRVGLLDVRNGARKGTNGNSFVRSCTARSTRAATGTPLTDLAHLSGQGTISTRRFAMAFPVFVTAALFPVQSDTQSSHCPTVNCQGVLRTMYPALRRPNSLGFPRFNHALTGSPANPVGRGWAAPGTCSAGGSDDTAAGLTASGPGELQLSRYALRR